MYTLPMKNWFKHYHALDGHGMIRRAKYMVHDVHFWGILVVIAAVIAITALIIWAELSGKLIQPLGFPGDPLYPISY